MLLLTAATVKTFYSLFSLGLFRLVVRAVNPSSLVFDFLQGRHRDPVMVLGAGPRCQVLRFTQAPQTSERGGEAISSASRVPGERLAAVPEGAAALLPGVKGQPGRGAAQSQSQKCYHHGNNVASAGRLALSDS